MPKKKIKTPITEIAIIPQIVQGSHLTITYHANGKIDMEWNWEQLNKEINEAIETWALGSASKTSKKTTTGVSDSKGKSKNKVSTNKPSNKVRKEIKIV